MIKIDEIRARHEAGERASAVEDREWLLSKVERLTRERDEARAEVERLRAALKPFAQLYLWPDDAGRLVAERVRSREDWDGALNDAESNEYRIRRGEIRAAREALEDKP